MAKGKRIDLHTHTLLSDGQLIPSELIRQAEMAGYKAIGLTDHVDASNLSRIIEQVLSLVQKQKFPITVIPGIELSYVHPDNIPELAKEAKALGAKLVVVHGESEAFDEPVYPGTNRVAVSLPGYVDILAHPGKISEAEAKLAATNGIYLELSSKTAHAVSNAHILAIAQKTGAKLLVNTDAHRLEDLLTQEKALKLLTELGLSAAAAEKILIDNPEELLRRLGY